LVLDAAIFIFPKGGLSHAEAFCHPQMNVDAEEVIA